MDKKKSTQEPPEGHKIPAQTKEAFMRNLKALVKAEDSQPHRVEAG